MSREERLADLLGDVIAATQISDEIAGAITTVIRSSDCDAKRHRPEAIRQLEQRRRAILSKQDRGYEDFVSGRISNDFWARKSQEWDAELLVIEAERARLEAPRPAIAVTAQKILELAIQAENLYKSQDPTDQRRLLETALSNCTFDRGTLCPTYRSPFDLLVRGSQTGDWRAQGHAIPTVTIRGVVHLAA